MTIDDSLSLNPNRCHYPTDKVIFFQQFTEGLCNYEGNVLENLGDIETASKCQFACQIYNLDNLDFPCNYFVHNNREQNCQFLSSTDRKCDVIRGPPTPSLDNCPEQPSTYWVKPNKSIVTIMCRNDELSCLFTKRFRSLFSYLQKTAKSFSKILLFPFS